MDRYEVGVEERARAEKTALDYVGAGRDVENPEIRATKVIYVWNRTMIPPPPKDAEYDIFHRGRKCLQISGFFNWGGSAGSFRILIDLSDYSVRGYSSSAGNMKLDILELYHLEMPGGEN